MSKWKCEICNSSFENFDARGFDNKIYCPLCYYKKLYKDTELERERLHYIIKEVREKVNRYPEFNYSNDYMIFRNEIKEILDKENI